MTEYAKLERSIVDKFDWKLHTDNIGAMPEHLQEVRWLVFGGADGALIGRTETASHDGSPHRFSKSIKSTMNLPRIIQQLKMHNDDLCWNYLITYAYDDNMPDDLQLRKHRTYIGRCRYGLSPLIDLALDRVGEEKADDDWLDQECIKVGRIAED